MEEVGPTQVTLVPDPPEVLTSNAGWVVETQKLLETATKTLLRGNPDIRISVFMDPVTCSEKDLSQLKAMGIHRIELYTEAYAKSFGTPLEERTLASYGECAQMAVRQGLGVNAGHDLNQRNLPALLRAIPEILEVSIGHELIAESLYEGLEPTIHAYLKTTENN